VRSTPFALVVVLAAGVAVGGCKDRREPKLERTGSGSGSSRVELEPPPPPPAEDPAFVELTRGAVPGSELVRFAPASLVGVARTNLLEQAFAVAAAYQLPGGAYLNLDVQNTFRRGGSTLADDLATRCKEVDEIGGYAACVRRDGGRFSAHWDLKDRLTATLSGPDEAQVRAAAAELPLKAISAVSREP
jgi:hypothetical protein